MNKDAIMLIYSVIPIMTTMGAMILIYWIWCRNTIQYNTKQYNAI